MSYQMEPIFKCDICGIAEPSPRWNPLPRPFGWKLLPSNWVGSESKNGVCFCEKCAAAIRGDMRELGIEVEE